jgi:C1A family cysteine protease
MALATHGMGWQKSRPDFRDYTPESDEVCAMLARGVSFMPATDRLPASESLASYFPPIDDQQCLNSSCAQACVDMVQYFDRRAYGSMVALSKLFVYQSTQRLLNSCGSCDLDLRTTLKAIVSFGIPGEQYWAYDLAMVDQEPPAFLYAIANRYNRIRYLRLDGRNRTGRETLDIVKAFLVAGFPSVFGFSVPVSLSNDSEVPYRPTFDTVQGGLAVVAVGYDDERVGTTKGALQFRNSWGHNWGENGYGWLPYAYVEEQLAVDFWTIISPDWLSSGEFFWPAFARSDV